MKALIPNLKYFMDLAFQANVFIRDNFSLAMNREWKEDGTPLTVTDTIINDLVVNSIRKDFPHIEVIGEEGSFFSEGAEYRVFCDPVDGTIPFSQGVPVSTFCVSLVKENTPLIGIISDPFMRRIWHAEKGEGAFLNDNRIFVSSHNQIKMAKICMIWWGKSPYNLHEVCRLLMNAGGKWIMPASLAYFGGLTASGEYEGTIFPGQKGWETAPMQLIVEEAGGVVTDIFGNPMQYGPKCEIQGHVISNGKIHDNLLKLVAEAQNVLQCY